MRKIKPFNDIKQSNDVPLDATDDAKDDVNDRSDVVAFDNKSTDVRSSLPRSCKAYVLRTRGRKRVSSLNPTSGQMGESTLLFILGLKSVIIYPASSIMFISFAGTSPRCYSLVTLKHEVDSVIMFI